jgi:hypothetical protein
MAAHLDKDSGLLKVARYFIDNASPRASALFGCGSSSSTHLLFLKKQHACTGALSRNSSNRPRVSPSVCLPLSTSSSSPAPLLHSTQPQRMARSGGSHRRWWARRSRRPVRHCKGATTSTRSCSARSRATPQRYPSITLASHRACSGCRIMVQIRGACHGVVQSPISQWLPRPFPSPMIYMYVSSVMYVAIVLS